MIHKQFLACLGLFYFGTILQAQEISITETNADRLVEICILTPETVPDDQRAVVDFDRDVVLQVSSYRRDYTPRNNKEGWQPYTFDIEVSLIDQYPSPERKLMPVKKLVLDDHQSLAVFQKDGNFFRDSREVILHAQDSGLNNYEFLFHYSIPGLFGETPPAEPCRRENNANNRIDVVVLNSLIQVDKQIAESLDLERNVGFRIASYKRSYTPRNDKEEWQPAGDMSAQLVEQYPEPNFSQAPVREVQISEHEFLLAFPKAFLPDRFPPSRELILNVNVDLGVFQKYRYLLHYNLEDLGVVVDVTEEKVGTKGNLVSEKAVADVPASQKNDGNSVDDIPVYELGEEINVGYWGYKVYGYEWPAYLYAGRVLSAKVKYLRISIACANLAKSPSMIPPFKLVDDEGAEYMESNDAMGDDEYFGLLETLNPKVPRYDYLLFDVPQKDYWLELDGGYWSTEKARVRIESVDREYEE